jgi:hypothetical protein
MNEVVGFYCQDCMKRLHTDAVGEHRKVTGHDGFHAIYKPVCYEVGDIVKLIVGPDKDHLGYVYEVYNRHEERDRLGVSIILDDGRDLGGFSGEEQAGYLEFIRKSGVFYEFRNVMQLSRDWDAGIFNSAFGN